MSKFDSSDLEKKYTSKFLSQYPSEPTSTNSTKKQGKFQSSLFGDPDDKEEDVYKPTDYVTQFMEQDKKQQLANQPPPLKQHVNNNNYIKPMNKYDEIQSKINRNLDRQIEDREKYQQQQFEEQKIKQEQQQQKKEKEWFWESWFESSNKQNSNKKPNQYSSLNNIKNLFSGNKKEEQKQQQQQQVNSGQKKYNYEEIEKKYNQKYEDYEKKMEERAKILAKQEKKQQNERERQQRKEEARQEGGVKGFFKGLF